MSSCLLKTLNPESGFKDLGFQGFRVGPLELVSMPSSEFAVESLLAYLRRVHGSGRRV